MVDRNSWKSVSHFHESTFVTSRVFFQEENGRLKRAAQREKTTKHEKTETVANLHGDISFIVAHTKFLSGRISHDVNKIRTYQTTWNSMQEMNMNDSMDSLTRLATMQLSIMSENQFCFKCKNNFLRSSCISRIKNRFYFFWRFIKSYKALQSEKLISTDTFIILIKIQVELIIYVIFLFIKFVWRFEINFLCRYFKGYLVQVGHSQNNETVFNQ